MWTRGLKNKYTRVKNKYNKLDQEIQNVFIELKTRNGYDPNIDNIKDFVSSDICYKVEGSFKDICVFMEGTIEKYQIVRTSIINSLFKSDIDACNKLNKHWTLHSYKDNKKFMEALFNYIDTYYK